MLALTILGNNSAIPAYGRHPTAQVVTTAEELLLFDCGEGTQIQIMNYRIRRSRINHIFISHLHGDHYFGLIGLLNSFALLSRIQPLHVYGPSDLIKVLDLQFKISDTKLPYQFTFHPIEKEGVLLDTKHYTVETFSTKHRIECWGFLVREKKNLRRINADAAHSFNIPPSFYHNLQKGEDYKSTEGTVIKNELVTFENAKPKAYAFAADTIYDPRIAELVSKADLLYHEATYPHALADKAGERYHSTTKQAADIALKAGVKKLLIGHFSAKFEDLVPFEAEAREIFNNTEVAKEGVTYLI